MSAPLVSVLIPAYRAGATIRAAVESVLAGGLPAASVEVLVESDDGGAYPQVVGLPSVHVAVSGAVASGVGPARNRALARARGAYVTYLDADDRWAPGWLAAILPLARSEGAAASALEVREAGGTVLRLWHDRTRLDFAALALTGASARGLIAADRCPPFADALSQDILHMLRIMAAQGGSLPLSDVPYVLEPGGAGVTAAADFSTRVHRAYLDHIGTLEGDRTLPPSLARAAAGVFRAKISLNAAFMAEGGGRSYYRYIADRLRG